MKVKTSLKPNAKDVSIDHEGRGLLVWTSLIKLDQESE